MPIRRALALPLLLGVSVAAVACSGSSDGSGDRIFESAPWTGDERFVYRVTDRGVDGEGRCEMFTFAEAEPGMTRLEEHCVAAYNDDSVVEVDADDLDPRQSVRTIAQPDEDSIVTHSVFYEGTVATFVTDDGEKRRETQRDLPEPTEEHPDPGWYDDKSIFWLVRGLPLAEDYEAQYLHVINVGQPRILPVTVEVEDQETVETAVGTFETWRVKLERDNTVYLLWVAETEPKPVVKARIESVNYEIIELETSSP
jgi:hypothetical protein